MTLAAVLLVFLLDPINKRNKMYRYVTSQFYHCETLGLKAFKTASIILVIEHVNCLEIFVRKIIVILHQNLLIRIDNFSLVTAEPETTLLFKNGLINFKKIWFGWKLR